MNTARLDTDRMQREYAGHGYTVVENLFPEASLQRIHDAALRIVDDFDIDRHRTVFSTRDRDRGRDRYFVESAEAVHCFLEEEAVDASGRLLQPKELAINKIGHALHDLDPVFRDFCRRGELADALRAIGCWSPRLWQTMYIFKQPRIGGEVRWHQDASYLITSPASVVGLWVAVEDAHRENGCLWVQPGGHRSPLRDVYHYDHVTQHGELLRVGDLPWPGEADAVPVEVPAGSLVVFSDHLPHYSSQNRSNRSRHAFSMHFAPDQAHWSANNWLQRPNLPAFLLPGVPDGG